MQDSFQNIACTRPSDNRDVAKQAKQKWDARDLGKGWWREKNGTAFSLPSSHAFPHHFLPHDSTLLSWNMELATKTWIPKTSVQVISKSILMNHLTIPRLILFVPFEVSSTLFPCESSHISCAFMAYPSAFTFNVNGEVFFFTWQRTLKFTSFCSVAVKEISIGSLQI